jgi:hypothetical protein
VCCVQCALHALFECVITSAQRHTPVVQGGWAS